LRFGAAEAVPTIPALEPGLGSDRSQLTLCHSTKASEHSVNAQLGGSVLAKVEAFSIPNLAGLIREKCNHSTTIDILKLDIEGAESNGFAEGCDDWLPIVRTIVIEIHGPLAFEVVRAATRRHGFRYAIFRDVHVFRK